MSEYFSYTPLSPTPPVDPAEVDDRFLAVSAGFDMLPAPDELQQNRWFYLVAGGTADALTGGLTPVLTSYEQGLRIGVRIAANNTGSATIDLDSLGPQDILRSDGSSLEADDLATGQIVDLVFDGTNFRMLRAIDVDLAPTLFALTVLDDADAAEARGTLGLDGIVAVGGNLGVGTETPAFGIEIAASSIAGRTIAVNGDPVVYLPDQSEFPGSLAIGEGLRELEHNSGEEGHDNFTIGLRGTGQDLGTGHSNILIGPNVGSALSDFSVPNGYSGAGGNSGNLVIGRNACPVANGMYDCTFIGINAGLNATNCMDNLGVGINALKNIHGGSENVALGVDAFLNLLGSGSFAAGTGHRNIAIGGFAGRFLNDGSSPKTGGKEGVYIGYDAKSSGNATSREIVIGAHGEGQGSNTITIGADTNEHIYMAGVLHVMSLDFSEPIGVDAGGTGATTAVDARDNLGLGTAATLDAGVPGGVAGLDGSGLVPLDQLPASVPPNVSTVADQAEMLALSAREGDLAIRTDVGRTFANNGGTSGTLADWSELLTPAGSVTSINGQIGDVVLVAADIASTPTGDVEATNVQDAIAELASEKLAASAYTAEGVLEKILTVDGLGSGLNADVVRGTAPTAFALSLLDDADAAAGRTTLGVSGTGADSAYAHRANNLSDLANVASARGNLGLGSIATQAASNVAITGGAISGLASLAVAGPLSCTGNATIGDNASDAHTVNGSLAVTSYVTAPKVETQGSGGEVRVNTRDAGNHWTIYNSGGTLRLYEGADRFSLSSAGASFAVAVSAPSLTLTQDLAVADGGTGASTAANARANLGLAIGIDVQAFDADLAAIAGLTSAADRLPYFTGSGTAALAILSSFGRSLIDDADAAASRTTLGLGSVSTQSASNVAISGGSVTNLSAVSASSLTTVGAGGQVVISTRNTGTNWTIYNNSGVMRFYDGGDKFTLSSSAMTVNVPVAAASLTLAADLPLSEGGTGASTASGARANLGLAIGTDVAPISSPAFTGTPTAGGLEIGYRDMPRVTGGLVRGKVFATSTNLTVNTGPAGGDTFMIYNDSAASITVTQGSGLTLRKSGTGSTGNCALAERGFATIWFNSTTEAVIFGHGVT